MQLTNVAALITELMESLHSIFALLLWLFLFLSFCGIFPLYFGGLCHSHSEVIIWSI